MQKEGHVSCRAVVKEDDGEMFEVVFKLSRWNSSSTYYLSGDFNAFGTGSLVFSNGTCHVRLMWGRYRYIVRENQYAVACRGSLTLHHRKGNYHNPGLRTFFDRLGNVLYIRVRTGMDADKSFLLTGGKRIEMGEAGVAGGCRYFQAALENGLSGRYSFIVSHGSSESKYGNFQAPHVESLRPEWVSSSVFYQIFPDRFSRVDETVNEARVLNRWSDAPAMGRFFGGNLKGVSEKLSHIKSLGADAVYSTPVFASSTEHRYDTNDYERVDPMLGTNDDLVALLKRMHSSGMRFVADAVFNHTGLSFPEFQRFIEGRSRWYIPHGKPEIFKGRFNMKHPSTRTPSYETWEGVGSLPKLNLSLNGVRAYLLRVLSKWTREAEVDGWRFDVGDSLPLDFVMELRNTLREIRKESFLLGEVWRDPSLWLSDDIFDGTMNYLFRGGIIDFVSGRISARQLANRLSRFCCRQPYSAVLSCYNMLGSHDTGRIASLLGTQRKVELAYALLFSLPGAPAVYYGDEFMMKGENAVKARGTVDWGKKPALGDLFASLSSTRRRYKALVQGNAVFNGKGETIAVLRTIGDRSVSFIASRTAVSVPMSRGEEMVLSSGACERGGGIRISANGWCFISRGSEH